MILPGVATDKQHELFNFGLQHPYSLLCADMRLGKSAVAVWLRQKRNVNCLIVCPSYLIPNWKKEILKWAPQSQVTMFKKGKDIYEPCDSDFVITSYDLVQKAEHLFEWCDMVVADEIHHLKSMKAKRSEFFHRALYENSVKYFHGLTGTPLKNRVKEFYSLIAMTYYDPRQTDHSFLDTYPDEILFADQFSFKETYDMTVRTKYGAEFEHTIVNYYGLRNEKELKKWLNGKYIRIRADKEDLPPISYLDTLVSDIDDKNLLAAFEAYFDEDIYNHEREREERVNSVLPEHKRNAAVKKVPFTIKYVENLVETVDCCLVYSDHREPCKKLADHFKVPAITGEMPASKRAQLVMDFQAGKFNILCATIGSLKEGADLFRAKDIVLNDPAWVPGDILQVINRTRALGEKDPRTVHRILGSPQDQKIWDVLEDKMQTIDKAT